MLIDWASRLDRPLSRGANWHGVHPASLEKSATASVAARISLSLEAVRAHGFLLLAAFDIHRHLVEIQIDMRAQLRRAHRRGEVLTRNRAQRPLLGDIERVREFPQLAKRSFGGIPPNDIPRRAGTRSAKPGSLLLLRQEVAETSLCKDVLSLQMEQPLVTSAVDGTRAGDRIVLAPAIGRAVGAADEPPVQHGEEPARSNAKPCLRLPASSAITARQPVSSHSRSNTSAGPMRRVAILVAASSCAAASTIALAANKSRSSWPFAGSTIARLRGLDLGDLRAYGFRRRAPPHLPRHLLFGTTTFRPTPLVLTRKFPPSPSKIPFFRRQLRKSG